MRNPLIIYHNCQWLLDKTIIKQRASISLTSKTNSINCDYKPSKHKNKKTKSVPPVHIQQEDNLQSETESTESSESGDSKIQIINKELGFSTLLLSPIFFFIKKMASNH